jgi:hypothetical protein
VTTEVHVESEPESGEHHHELAQTVGEHEAHIEHIQEAAAEAGEAAEQAQETAEAALSTAIDSLGHEHPEHPSHSDLGELETRLMAVIDERLPREPEPAVLEQLEEAEPDEPPKSRAKAAGKKRSLADRFYGR